MLIVSENNQPSFDESNVVDTAKEDNLIGDDSNIIGLSSTNLEQNRFECRGCGYIYDPSEGIKKLNIAKNTPFEMLDINSFRCPVCRVSKDLYKDIGPRSKPSGFEENLVYGFGFNSLPPGQKNILIFGGLAFAAACFLSLYSLH
tara:strand:- start:534 stop:968 length:435 start_codon:yes stop_codon:yes gene_type:complete